MNRLAVAAFALVALLLPGSTLAQTSTQPLTEFAYCITVQQDDFDYTDDPGALMEALLAGDVTVTAVSDVGECVAPLEALTYEVWADHIIDAYERLRKIARSVEGTESTARMLGALRKMRDWSEAEQAWLADAAPEDCWASEHRDWTRGVEKVRSGSEAILRAWANRQYSDASRSLKTMTAGLKLLTKVNGSWLDECEATP